MSTYGGVRFTYCLYEPKPPLTFLYRQGRIVEAFSHVATHDAPAARKAIRVDKDEPKVAHRPAEAILWP